MSKIDEISEEIRKEVVDIERVALNEIEDIIDRHSIDMKKDAVSIIESATTRQLKVINMILEEKLKEVV